MKLSAKASVIKENQKPQWLLGIVTVAISVLALVVTFWQASIARQAMRVDQRAWVSVVEPKEFPLTATPIPVITQLQNTGKTPAVDVKGEYVATVVKKGEAVTIGDFSLGHPHNRFYVGSLFPNSPIETRLPVLRYGPKSAELIVANDDLRRDLANGSQYIIFYGRVTYYDVFGVQHWSQFCTGSGSGLVDSLKECIAYNDVDHDKAETGNLMIVTVKELLPILFNAAVALASLAVSVAAMLIARQALTYAQQVADRDERNWAQRHWFDLLLRAELARSQWERMQVRYIGPEGTRDFGNDRDNLMFAMREILTYASVVPQNSAIDALFEVVAKFDAPVSIFSKELLAEMVDAVDGVRERARVDKSVLREPLEQITS